MEGEVKEFNEVDFEQKLLKLKDTQEAIQGLSMWCLHKRTHHKKIVATWLNVLKQVKVDHRLTLFYLANDVIQHSKRKNYEFVESWGTALQRATTMVRDDKVKPKILRIFKIWKDRQVYDEDFIADLNGLLAVTVAKTKSKEVDEDEFQVQTVVNYIRKCVNLQTETDKSLKTVIKTTLPDKSALKGLKDRSKVLELQKEIDDIAKRYERYMQNLQREIKHRAGLIQVLKEADEFYKTQRGEVKVVANAYKMFGTRIKKMQEKLEELRPMLPSPAPSPPLNAPSPSPEDDFGMPGDAFAFSANNGFLTYGNASLPFDPNDFQRKSPSPSVQSIQVINNNPNVLADVYVNSNSSIDSFFKTLMPTSDSTAYDPSSVANLSFSEYSETTLNMSFGAESTSPGSLPSYAPITMQGYGMSSSNPTPFSRNQPYSQSVTDGPPPVIMQPPPPQQQQHQSESVDPKMWTTKGWDSDQPLMDAPHSPPEYDQKARNEQTTVEYQETEMGGASTDVDHRTLTDVLARKIDIDHRNLISLTGSPGQGGVSDAFSKPSTDTDLRSQMLKPPPQQPTEIVSHDIDFRLPPPPVFEKGDDDLRTPMYNAPLTILDAPALSDLENLLAMAKNVNVEDLERQAEEGDKKTKENETGADMDLDMDFSDEDRDGQAFNEGDKQRTMQQEAERKQQSITPDQNPNMFALPPPPLPNFSDDNNALGNFDWNSGEGFPFNPNCNELIPPPPPMLEPPWNSDGPDAPWNFQPMMPPHAMGDNMLGGPGLLPTPPRALMNQQQQPRGYPPPLMGTRRAGGMPPMDNGSPNFNNPMNNFRPRGPRGPPMGGGPMRGSPFFRGGPRGNFRGNFRGGRGRW